jgi:hypothetical protein
MIAQVTTGYTEPVGINEVTDYFFPELTRIEYVHTHILSVSHKALISLSRTFLRELSLNPVFT